ncbi:hypothetical protein GYMLUDRAFT_169512 [Collybiopsis luxurians FD-317 M1]|uniref:Major facilitator superfamily (MFS) profile domain-containing protein n=1 Tax=Collybiopsis luxurians FD-317 M1 TaxID=944289 RepID=A0A0D0CAU5_9AGAR|nr:hypothetical protein GYMLUDRAFT_169512 [Collybiopsis luxurians FD-317 M1]
MEKPDEEKAEIQDIGSNEDSRQTQEFPVLDPVAEKRLLRKQDMILMPLFALICKTLISVSPGNAKIAGIEKDLGMVGVDYNIALTIFYIFYVSADVPSNLALKRFGSIWLALLVFAFGIVSIGTAFIKSYSGLIATRVFLGIAEGGTLSGLTYLLARYYRRSEIVFRVGIFFGISTPLAGAFGGLLASGLLSIGDIGIVTSWRKIFLVGIITSGIGIMCMFVIPADPRRTRMFNDQERALALARLDADQAVRTQGRKEGTSLKLIGRAFNHSALEKFKFCLLVVNISFQGLSLFMPTVIATLGHFTTVESQLRTVPPYLVSAVWSVLASYWSFKIKKRAIPLFVSTVLMVTGYAIAIGTRNPHARYGACFLSITGSSLTGPMILAWGTENAAPDTVRAVVTALIPGIGALGSVIAVWTYLPSDAPNYHKGNSLNLATGCFVCLLIIIEVMYIRWENAKRDRGERDYRVERKSLREVEELGYLHPEFRYQE